MLFLVNKHNVLASQFDVWFLTTMCRTHLPLNQIFIVYE